MVLPALQVPGYTMAIPRAPTDSREGRCPGICPHSHLDIECQSKAAVLDILLRQADELLQFIEHIIYS